MEGRPPEKVIVAVHVPKLNGSRESLSDVLHPETFYRSLGEGRGGTEQQLLMPDPAGSGIHMAVSRSRLGQINDPSRNRKFAEAISSLLEDHFKGTSL